MANNITVAVMDYNRARVFIYPYAVKEMIDDDTENKVIDFILENGHHLSECSYMFGEKVSSTIIYGNKIESDE